MGENTGAGKCPDVLMKEQWKWKLNDAEKKDMMKENDYSDRETNKEHTIERRLNIREGRVQTSL